MIKKILNKLWPSEGNEWIETPLNTDAEFVLMYNQLHIGTLKLHDAIWTFEYSVIFKNQNEVPSIIDFPDTTKVYTSNQLWPFFSYRIPGLNQPQVQEIIKRKQIRENNIVELLKVFGKNTIFNPFQLTSTQP